MGCHIGWNGNEAVSATAHGLICREIERVDSAFRSLFSVQNALTIWPIWEYATEEAKKKYLDGMISGELVGSFGLTEPDHGSDPGGMKTRAKKDVNLIINFKFREMIGF